MRFLIIDDQIDFANMLKEKILKDYGFEYDISVDIITDDFEQIQINHHYQLLLCDLMLGNQSGIEIGKKIFAKNQIDNIVYISANNNLIFDVLPYDPLFFVRKSNLDADLDVLMRIFLSKYISNQYIEVKYKGNKTKILESSMMYIEVEGRYLRIYANDHEEMNYMPLKDFASYLDPKKFVQINKYTIINLDYLLAYRSDEVTMKDHKHLLLGRVYKKTFKKKYMEYYL